MLVNTKNLLTKLLSTSLIISTSFAISACCDEKIDEIDSEVFDELADQNTSQKLIDSDGNYYILTDNDDGRITLFIPLKLNALSRIIVTPLKLKLSKEEQ